MEGVGEREKEKKKKSGLFILSLQKSRSEERKDHRRIPFRKKRKRAELIVKISSGGK